MKEEQTTDHVYFTCTHTFINKRKKKKPNTAEKNRLPLYMDHSIKVYERIEEEEKNKNGGSFFNE